MEPDELFKYMRAQINYRTVTYDWEAGTKTTTEKGKDPIVQPITPGERECHEYDEAEKARMVLVKAEYDALTQAQKDLYNLLGDYEDAMDRAGYDLNGVRESVGARCRLDFVKGRSNA